MKAKLKQELKGKTILITGGTGSFGQTMAAKLLDFNPQRIIIFSRDEQKQFDMRNHFDTSQLKFVVGDVRDTNSLDKVMDNVDYIFHASALKQVPTCEFFPMEAIKTNVLGTYNVINSAIAHKVKKVVALSTDKAVYPINVMGITKALMEKITIAESKNLLVTQQNTVLCTVRYGNVLYTRGSVMPYFVSLIRENKKLPITHFGMTRFLLSLSDAVDLVLYALVNGENGFVYVRKSPACTLETLAKAVCKIFNYEKGYYEVGIRAGEKMHETLITQEELLRAQDAGKYYKIPPESQGLDYNKYFFRGKKTEPEKYEAFTSENTKRLALSQTIGLLLQLPEIKIELSNWQVTDPKIIKGQKRI